jgi:hypothetical protein
VSVAAKDWLSRDLGGVSFRCPRHPRIRPLTHPFRRTRALSYTLDPTKSPMTISATLVDGKTKLIFTGIYALDGDTLKICLLPGGTAPPTDFKTSAEHESLLLKLKREKK